MDAIALALSIPNSGYHIFALGSPGSGRHTIVREQLMQAAKSQGPALDWCYVHNFKDPDRPQAMSLPQGEGSRLQDAMQRFAAELGKSISLALEGDEFRSQEEAIQKAAKDQEEALLQQLGHDATTQGVALLRSPHGFAFAPMRNGAALAAEDFDSLSTEEREKLDKVINEFGEKLRQLLHELPRMRRAMQVRLQQLTQDTVQMAVGHLVDELKLAFSDHRNVQDFLQSVLEDVVRTAPRWREIQQGEEDDSDASSVLTIGQRYLVNLLVGHPKNGHAPVLDCDHPTYANLMGRVDQVAHLGTLLTNFTLIKPGALHRANGGYLMLDAVKVLSEPGTWNALKRALKTGELRIESLPQVLGWPSTSTLEPQPIALRVKVVLLGERSHYYLLQELDPEFSDLFKVAADFDDEVDKTPQNLQRWAELVARLGRVHGLLPMDRTALVRLAEFSSRTAGDAQKLSTQTRALAALLHEAHAVALAGQHQLITAPQVEAALLAQRQRANRLRESLHEAFSRHHLLIDCEGSHIGQVNGLAVTELGELRFGYPVRVSVTTRLGDGEVIDIERESTLGGPIHSKGVLILVGFLAGRYAQDLPLSVHASLVFEQSYGAVEGDSASLAEACALLSSLSMLPIRQGLAVTGSMNQFGQVQPVGGIDEKVEGFFDLCQMRGLSGDQGVLIPRAHVGQLMLHREVVEACRQGKFHVYPVDCVDQAMTLLTGVEAGQPDAKGEVPAGTVNHRVAARLLQLSVLRSAWSTGSALPPHGMPRKRSHHLRPVRPSR